MRKRLAFVRACSKLLVSCSTRFKVLISKDPHAFVNAQSKLLDQVEKIIFQSEFIPVGAAAHTKCILVSAVPPEQQVSECALLLGELLTGTLASAPLNSVLAKGLCEWLSTHTGGSVVVLGLIKTLGISVQNQQMLGEILEDTLEAFFRDPNGQSFHKTILFNLICFVFISPQLQACYCAKPLFNDYAFDFSVPT